MYQGYGEIVLICFVLFFSDIRNITLWHLETLLTL